MSDTDFIRVAVAICIFTFASFSDWKTRRVKDRSWMLMGAFAFVLLEADLLGDGFRICAQSLALVALLLFVDIFWDREKAPAYAKYLGVALYAVSFVVTAGIGYMVAIGRIDWDWVSGPFMVVVMIAVLEVFYIFDVIKGGADAKGLIALTILFPWYPQLIGSLPAILPSNGGVLEFFTFSFSVLFVGALLTLVFPVYFLAKNFRSGNGVSMRSLFGFKMPVDEVEKNFVWLMEWAEGGAVRFSARRLRSTESLKADIEALKGLGRTEAWVTYKIPFLIPLTVGLVIVIILGNPLFILY